MKVDKRQLWDSDIRTPDGLNELLDKLFVHGEAKHFPELQFKMDKDCPPLFFFVEARDATNYVSSFTYYGGGGSKSAIVSMGGRQLLTLHGDRVDNSVRGEVLNAFCCLEFVIDAMCCSASGVFTNQLPYSDLLPEFSNTPEHQGTLSSTEMKIQLLYDKGLLTKHARDILLKAKRIRNSLAHQFLPVDNFGVTDRDFKRYGSYPKAMEVIFEGAWFHLLTSFNPIQNEIATWLSSSSLHIAIDN